MDAVEFERRAQIFLQALFSDLQTNGIELPPAWEIDHLCYRVDSPKRYLELKSEFADFADLLTESEVKGRPIATFRLQTAIHFRGWQIPLVELPAPKPSKPTPEGFEHIEVVCDLPFSELEKKFGHLHLDRSGLEKPINPELEIVLGERNLKFHHQSLAEVIRLEQQQAAQS